jgi:ring-1,2-phenylacetyl-CoA epoxidase subunit PaaD
MDNLTYEDVWVALDEVKDPEIPAVSVVEMGMVQQVAISARRVIVIFTPTFSGCPAVQVIKTAIRERLLYLGVESVEVRETLSPAWSTDWITDEARQKLKAFGLAPPPKHAGDSEILLSDSVSCPYCDSQNTVVKNTFGPTLCRAIYYCNDCQQPFEQFKPL